MIVQDSASLTKARALLESGSIRYSDQFAYRVITRPEDLEAAATSALDRGDVAVVELKSLEHTMEDHAKALTRIKRQRRVQELKDIRGYVTSRPGLKKALDEAIARKPSLDVLKFVNTWEKEQKKR